MLPVVSILTLLFCFETKLLLDVDEDLTVLQEQVSVSADFCNI